MIYCHGLGLVNALGADNTAIQTSLANNRSGLKSDCSWLANGQTTFLGTVDATLPEIPQNFSRHHSRNNQLLLAALAQIRPQLDQLIARYGKQRIAIIMGTSTSGIHEGELAIKHYIKHQQKLEHYDYQQQQLADPSQFLADYLGLTGPTYTISTACSSSARAIISGACLLESGLADVALVGGADSLCKMAINGFHALEAISDELCAPFSQHRKGINIGEAAGLMLLSKEPEQITLMGWGASSDAWHMSAPHPEGEGAENAMKAALTKAGLKPEEVGYINLHGTATKLNDSAEAKAVYRVFADKVPCSSSKHLTGHTLGAAGITEAGLAVLMLQHNLSLPVQVFSQNNQQDNSLDAIHLVTEPEHLSQATILSNAFAFGGNNACLIFGRVSE